MSDFEIKNGVLVKYHGNDKQVIIPYSVTSIGEGAFSWCTSLKNIVIPSSVTSIGEWAFSWCESLTSIEISSSVTSIGDSAFNWCTSLKSIEISSSVTSIGEWAFNWCTSLKSIDISYGVKSIGKRAFYGCESLENIVIPASVKNIGDRAFYGCNSLKKVILPTRFKGKNAEIFNYSCEITYKDMEITYSKNKYFANKISANPQDLYLTDFKIKDDILVKYKGKDSNLIIPYGIIGIKSEAFCGCELLESITIPSSVTHIGKRIFANCNNLNHIKVEKDNPNYFSKSNCIIKKQSKTLIAGCNSSTIPKDIKAIGSSAFAMCRLLKRVSIPSGVTSIGDNAFFECVSLNKITIPTKFKGQEERLGICKDCKITYLDDDDEIIYSKN